MDRPLFEVTTPVADAAARRLTTAAKVNELLGLSPTTDKARLEAIIDAVSADCARYCGLARPANGATPPTFGQEVVKAVWLATDHRRSTKLLLPWRVPVSAVGQVVDGDTILTVGVDFRLLGGAMLERLAGDRPVCWSSGSIVVPYTAGFDLAVGVPAEIEGQVVQQVKMALLTVDDVPGLRSEAVPDVYSASYSVAGGDTIGESGLLRSLEAALDPFKNWAV